MYHGRFQGTHYEAGFRYGALIKKKGVVLNTCPTFPIDDERIAFGKKCVDEVKKYYPEIIDEIKGLADGNEASYAFLSALIFSMYCFKVETHCSCIAYNDGESIIFGRNSDFLVSLEKQNMNVLYRLDNVYAFTGNTTAFIEIEDGINEYGLAIGLTFVPIEQVKPGFNIGVLTRFLLEKCKTVKEALVYIKELPIASGGTLTMADSNGDLVVAELSPEEISIIHPNNNSVFATNVFTSSKMKSYNLPNYDNWRAEERFEAIKEALAKNSLSLEFVKNLLSGKYGFICQYDRKKNADTVWSVIYFH